MKTKRMIQTLLIAAAGFFGVLLLTKTGYTCPVKRLTGYPCPGCGMTRAFLSILHGRLYEAFCWHIAAIPLFLGLAGYTVCKIADIIFDRELCRKIEARMADPRFIAAMALLAAAGWIVSILRKI